MGNKQLIILLLTFALKFIGMCVSVSFVAWGIFLAIFSVLIPFGEVMIYYEMWPTSWIGENYVQRSPIESVRSSFLLIMVGIGMYVVGWQIERWVKDGKSIESRFDGVTANR